MFSRWIMTFYSGILSGPSWQIFFTLTPYGVLRQAFRFQYYTCNNYRITSIQLMCSTEWILTTVPSSIFLLNGLAWNSKCSSSCLWFLSRVFTLLDRWNASGTVAGLLGTLRMPALGFEKIFGFIGWALNWCLERNRK